jgi:hypothetical protein
MSAARWTGVRRRRLTTQACEIPDNRGEIPAKLFAPENFWAKFDFLKNFVMWKNVGLQVAPCVKSRTTGVKSRPSFFHTKL